MGSILVHIDRPETRKGYTIAHEIGHYVNPVHRANGDAGFRCSRKDMGLERAKPGDKHAKMELEANQFAAELLMPEKSVAAYLRQKAYGDIQHILDMATYFQVSKESAARRYIPRLDEPAAIVFSQNGLIRYIKSNSNFPRLSVWSGDKIPDDCLSATSSAQTGQVTDVVETPGYCWLERSAGVSLGEQTLAQRNGYRMTLLTAEIVEQDEDEWEPPSFRRH